LSQTGCILGNRTEIVSFNVSSYSRMILRGKAHADQSKAIICHPAKSSAIRAWIKLIAFHLHTAPVGEIRPLQWWLYVVLESLYGLCHSGMHTVCPNDYPGLFDDRRFALFPTANPANATVFDQEFIHGKPGAQLGAAGDRSIHENGIKHFAARRKCFLHSFSGRRRTSQREGTEVEVEAG